MTFLKKLFNFYINSSIHVALAVYSLVRITEYYFNLNYNESLNYFIFYGSIFGYNFIKYAGVVKFYYKSLTYNLKIVKIFSFICLGLTIYYGAQLPINNLLYFIPFAFLTLLYAVPFFTKSLRSISSLKIIVIAIVWAGVTVLLPVLNQAKEINLSVVLQTLQRFLFVVALTLPFDIRDIEFDKKTLGTIPQKIGIEKTKKLGFVLIVFCLVLEFMITPNYNFRNVFLFVSFVLLFFLMRAKVKQPKYYSSFWVEAIPIFWFILLYYI